MTRRSLKLLLALAFSLSLGGAASAADGPCTIATKGNSPTAQACAKGGRAEAKKTMKEMVKTAKANGGAFTCEGCHKDLESFALTANARADYGKLVAAQKK